MRLYKLLKDLPTVKAGQSSKRKLKSMAQEFESVNCGQTFNSVRRNDNFDEWFEPTDSINWNL